MRRLRHILFLGLAIGILAVPVPGMSAGLDTENPDASALEWTIVDIMAGILASNRPGHLAEAGKHSLFVMAIRIDAFMDAAEFKADMDRLLGRLAGMSV